MNKLHVLIGMLLIFFASSCTPKMITAYSSNLSEHREHYKQEFLKDENAPLRSKEELAQLDFYKADYGYVCQCDFVKFEERQPFLIDTYAGTTKEYEKYGIAKCSAHDKNFELTLYKILRFANHPVYGKLLFLPFKDYTNGEETYGGGRYIDLSEDDVIDGKITIDFNHAYNPWCAYSDGYNCPIPPVENHLKFGLKAGEKMYKGAHKSTNNEEH